MTVMQDFNEQSTGLHSKCGKKDQHGRPVPGACPCPICRDGECREGRKDASGNQVVLPLRELWRNREALIRTLCCGKDPETKNYRLMCAMRLCPCCEWSRRRLPRIFECPMERDPRSLVHIREYQKVVSEYVNGSHGCVLTLR
jgi:hypothetical protein